MAAWIMDGNRVVPARRSIITSKLGTVQHLFVLVRIPSGSACDFSRPQPLKYTKKA